MEPEIIQPNVTPPVTETPKPDKKIWGGWATVGLSLVIFAVYFAAQTAVTVFYAFSWLAAHEWPIDINSIMELASNGDLVSVATIVSAIFGVGFIVLFVKMRKGANLKGYLGLDSLPKKAFFISLAVIIVLLVVSSVLPQFLNITDDSGFTNDAYETATCPVVLWIAVAVFAPLFEEGFFRGFLFVGLKESRVGAIGAVAITSVFWAALHIQYSIYGILSILILGIVLGIIRLKTNSLWSTLILHALWNLIAMVGTVLYING